MPRETETDHARVMAVYSAAPRLVRAAIDAPSERTATERDEAMAELWTGDAAEDATRLALLIEALADYAAVLARKAYGSRRDARNEVLLQVSAMLPGEAATRALLARQLEATDEDSSRDA
jgi:hypothetical protein